MSGKGWTLAVIAFVTFSAMFTISVVGPLLGVLADVDRVPLGGNPNTSIGVIFALGGLSLAAFQIPFASLSDRFGRKKFIVAGSIAVGFFVLMLGYSKRISEFLGLEVGGVGGWGGSTYLMAGFRFLQGAAAAATWPILMALISSEFPAESMGTAMGVFGASFGLGMALGPVLGPTVASVSSVHTPFVVAFALSFAAGVLALILRERGGVKSSRAFSIPRDLRLYVLSLVVFAMMFGMGEVVVIYPRYFTGVLGYGLGELAAAMAAASLSFAFLQPLMGRLADKYDKVKLTILGLILFTAATTLLILSRSSFEVYGAMLLFGVAGSLTFPAASSILALISPRGREGAYSGFYNMVLSLGVTISPIVVGALADVGGYVAGFTSTPVLTIIAVSAFLTAFRRSGVAEPSSQPQ